MVKVNTLDEHKLLLFSDIAARVPYNPRMRVSIDIHHVDDLGEETIEHQEEDNTLVGAIHHYDNGFIVLNENHNWFNVEDVKLYLRPMSSMTPKEIRHYESLCDLYIDKWGKHYFKNAFAVAWLYTRHFDVNGLLPRDLALEAPEGMYNFD